MLKTKEEIIKWLERYKVENYTINEELTVDVNGNIDLNSKNIKSIDVNFNKINGSFYCHHNKLTNLKGCPKEVSGDFFCSHNKLISLEGCPDKVVGLFWCGKNKKLGELQKITDFNTIKIILNKEFLDLILEDKKSNKEVKSKLKI
jgi:hypothetical protein